MADGSLTFDTKVDAGGFGAGMDKIKGLANTALGVFTGNMMTRAVDGLKSLGQSALDSVSSLEQNIGGVETLFKSSADTVIKNADNAFKTAGMSANQYMETVTSFSASLLQSVGGNTEKAAKVADTAITDMSDNANKMGTSMELIQNAYQGFAKQNYTMLDNLKLGYGGTKKEMERLLADAQKITGVKYDINNLNDVYSAIHVIQGELGITGTTAKEASTTIEGSMNSAKAAWDNFINGSGDAQQLADAFSTAAGNIVKALSEIIPRLANTIPALISAIVPQIPTFVGALVPAVVSAAKEVMNSASNAVASFDFGGLADRIVTAITTFISSGGVDKFAQSASNLIVGLATGIGKMLPKLIPAAVQAILYLAKTLILHIPDLIVAAGKLVLGLAQGIINSLPYIGQALLQILAKIGELGLQVLSWIATNLPVIINAVITWIAQLPGKIWNFLVMVVTKLGEWGSNMLNFIVTNVPVWISNIVQFFAQLPGKIWTWLVSVVTKVLQWGQNMVSTAGSAMVTFLSRVVSLIAQLPGKIWSWLVNAVTRVVQWGHNMVSRAGSAMSSFLGKVVSIIAQLPGKVWSWLVNVVSKVAEWGGNLARKGAEAAKGLFNAVVDGVKSLPGKMLSIGKDIIKGIWNGISSGWNWLKEKVGGVAKSLLDKAKGVLGINSPSRAFRDEVGKWILPGIEVGMEKTLPAALKSMKANVSSLVAEAQNSVSGISAQMSIGSAASLRLAGAAGVVIYNDNSVKQENTYNTPVASPSAVARSQREAVRKLVGGVS